MELQDAIALRHSVRAYTSKEIEAEKANCLKSLIDNINKDNSLNFQLFLDEPRCFSGILAKYGSFKNVKNYIALVGRDNEVCEEKCGYFGEQLVLTAQILGLNTCFVAVTYNKSKCKAIINENEKIHCIISLGYGDTQGVSHKSKSISEISNLADSSPEWFRNGINSALLAPTGLNKQAFYIKLNDDESITFERGKGNYTLLDQGIVKYNFEVGANRDKIIWK